MTKDEAIEAMMNGEKVVHRFFTSDEWIMINNGNIVAEDGMILTDFWEYRNNETWDTDWSIWVDQPKVSNKTSKTPKVIWDYFEDSVDFPNDIAESPVPYYTVYNYVSATFLNGFINYVTPVSCFVLDRYVPLDADLTDREVSVQKPGSNKWFKFKRTKKELIDSIASGSLQMFHTKLDCFGDDVFILTKIPSDGINKFMIFHYDMDVSDCSVGRFMTHDSEDDVKQSVINWLEQCKDMHKGTTIVDDCDNGICDYNELPVSFLKGWISF